MIFMIGILDDPSDIIDMNGVHDSKCIKSIPICVLYCLVVASRPPEFCSGYFNRAVQNRGIFGSKIPPQARLFQEWALDSFSGRCQHSKFAKDQSVLDKAWHDQSSFVRWNTEKMWEMKLLKSSWWFQPEECVCICMYMYMCIIYVYVCNTYICVIIIYMYYIYTCVC